MASLAVITMLVIVVALLIATNPTMGCRSREERDRMRMFAAYNRMRRRI